MTSWQQQRQKKTVIVNMNFPSDIYLLWKQIPLRVRSTKISEKYIIFGPLCQYKTKTLCFSDSAGHYPPINKLFPPCSISITRQLGFYFIYIYKHFSGAMTWHFQQHNLGKVCLICFILTTCKVDQPFTAAQLRISLKN